MLKVYTAIDPLLKKQLLWRGTIVAVGGALILIFCGIFCPTQVLTQWGWAIFAFAIFLIIIGQLPYKKVCSLENEPSSFLINDQNECLYFEKGIIQRHFNFDHVEKFSYCQRGGFFGLPGLSVHFKNQKTDLFFPFFSLKTCTRLQDFLETEDHE